MSRARAVNMRHEPYDVRIDRESHWGNPFRIGIHGSRGEVVESYRRLLQYQREEGQVTDDDLRVLAGQRLGCWCAPLACHGDILAEAVNVLMGETDR